MSEAHQTWAPGFWMCETSGVLRPAIEAYLAGEIDPDAPEMTGEQIAAVRAYLRQWIGCPMWQGPKIEWLRQSVGGLTTRDTIAQWIAVAENEGVDPL